MGFNRIEPNQNSLGFSAWLKPLLLLIIWVLGSSVLATKVEAATIPDIPDQVPGTTYTLPSGYTYTSSNLNVATVSGINGYHQSCWSDSDHCSAAPDRTVTKGSDYNATNVVKYMTVCIKSSLMMKLDKGNSNHAC